VTGISGDVSGISGSMTGISGDVSGVTWNIDDCEITYEERLKWVSISDLIF
jgi:hypothetical protein